MSSRGISQKGARAQLHLFLARARDLDAVDVPTLERRYNLPAGEIEQALAAARQTRGRLI